MTEVEKSLRRRSRSPMFQATQGKEVGVDEEQYRDDMEDQGDPDAELDQVAAAIREGAPMVAMMFSELTRCGLSREDAASVAAAWFTAS